MGPSYDTAMGGPSSAAGSVDVVLDDRLRTGMVEKVGKTSKLDNESQLLQELSGDREQELRKS